jgi:hypothetical protein
MPFPSALRQSVEPKLQRIERSEALERSKAIERFERVSPLVASPKKQRDQAGVNNRHRA